MMLKPDVNPPSYGLTQTTVPSSGDPSLANTIPVTLQWNASPGHSGPNEYPGPSIWNAPLLPQATTSNSNEDTKSATQSYITLATMPRDVWLKYSHQVFLKGKPLALGIVLIVTATLQIAFTIALPFTMFTLSLVSGVHFWGAIIHIIAGSLTMAAQKNLLSPCLIKGSLALCVASSLSGIVGFSLNMTDMMYINSSVYGDIDTNRKTIALLIVMFLLFMNVLVICVSFSIAVFACCAVHNPMSHAPLSFVIQNNVAVDMTPPNLPPTKKEESLETH